MRFHLLILIPLFFICRAVNAQEEPKSIPYVDIESVYGKLVNTKSFFKEKKTLIIVYSWGCSWGPACQDILDSLNLYYKMWGEEFNVKSLAINLKLEREVNQCNEDIINKERWTFDFYWDKDDNFTKGLYPGDEIHRNCPRIYIVNQNNQVISSWYGKNDFKKQVEEALLKIKSSQD